MTSGEAQVVSAVRDVRASAAAVFELIADPAQQVRWDGNDNLGSAAAGQRVRSVGEVFVTTLTSGAVRDNHVVEFAEGRRIAWRPAEHGGTPPGHLWRWELEKLDDGRSRVTHTYDWSQLADESRLARARATTIENLNASLDRLAALAQRGSVVAAWVDALRSSDADALVSLLAPEPSFVSPFSVWTDGADVRRACRARVRAFQDWRDVDVVERGNVAWVRWQAQLSDDAGSPIEGVELLGLEDAAVHSIDVFLRPAAELDRVWTAMSRAWGVD